MGRAVTTIHKERGGGGYGDDNGIKQPATREHLMEELEGLWRGLDELFASMSPADWARKHGKHWTFEDIPYHLAYFDKGIATAIERGGDVPEGERQLLRTMNNLHEWNTCQFAKRPPDQTVEESLRQMRQSRDEVRRVVTSLSEADLDERAWMLLIVGWTTRRLALQMCIPHMRGHGGRILSGGRWETEGRGDTVMSAADFFTIRGGRIVSHQVY